MLPAGAGSTIEGMQLDGAGGASDIGPRIYADGVVLRDNEITNEHTSICVHITAYYSNPPPQGVVIERNRIHDCGALPSTNKDHGIYVANARDTVIRDNWIYDNVDRGIQLYPDAQHTRVIGNVIDGNGEGVVFSGEGAVTSNHNLVEGNVIAELEPGLERLLRTERPRRHRQPLARQLRMGGREQPRLRLQWWRGNPVSELHRKCECGCRSALLRSCRRRLHALVGEPVPARQAAVSPGVRRPELSPAVTRSASSSTDICPRSPSSCERTETTPASCSRSPTTSM